MSASTPSLPAGIAPDPLFSAAYARAVVTTERENLETLERLLMVGTLSGRDLAADIDDDRDIGTDVELDRLSEVIDDYLDARQRTAALLNDVRARLAGALSVKADEALAALTAKAGREVAA